MGCGKSSVGRRLSELLCCRFLDLDEVIEAGQGRRIPEIFSSEGEAAFRAMELDALKMTINSGADDLVLALGGGTVMTPECAELVHGHTCCIYLRASVETLVSRLKNEAAGRPLLQTSGGLLERISALMSLRASTYEFVAHHAIDTDGKSLDEIAKEAFDFTRG